MLFTVVNYFPTLEEEVPHNKIELAKKAAAESQDAGGDDDSESDSENFITAITNFCWTSLPVNEHHYVRDFGLYSCPPENKSTPPPKV